MYIMTKLTSWLLKPLASYDFVFTVLTISEKANFLRQGWREGTLQGEVVTLCHPSWWKGVQKTSFLLQVEA